MTGIWHLAFLGVAFSVMAAAAMWQDFRARLPFLLDPRLVALCTEAVQEVTGHAPRLPSGPLHDAVEMARVMPA